MTTTAHHPPENLAGTDAIAMLREVITEARTCMLVTQHSGFPLDARPMSAQAVDEAGTVWFLSAADSDKNRDVALDDRVTLIVQNNSKYEYAQVSGHASIHRDKTLIEKYWSSVANAWFEGKDDPRVTLLAVRPESGHYWTTKNGKILTGVRMLLSAAGAPVDEGGKHGELRL